MEKAKRELWKTQEQAGYTVLYKLELFTVVSQTTPQDQGSRVHDHMLLYTISEVCMTLIMTVNKSTQLLRVHRPEHKHYNTLIKSHMSRPA